jgi:hypothetical protein
MNTQRGPAFAWICGVAGALLAGLIAYSQIQAFSWDEGFHLLAAALIRSGKKPYLDFCFPQTPLNAYFYSAWMRVFGESWRAMHVVASILTAGAILLAADYFYVRFPSAAWRLAGAIAVALFMGLNNSVVFFGTIAQAYALCLFLLVAAFRIAVLSSSRTGAGWAGLVGLIVSASAASSLLTAPALPVLLVWTVAASRAGSRLAKFAAFVTGAIVPFLPVAWLFLKSPHTVFFNIAGYQLFGRRARWEGATGHDLSVLTSWVDSGSALLLGALAVAGLIFIARKTEWPRSVRSEFFLCAFLAIAMSLEIGVAHPTFTWYFVFTVPFVAILAAAGLCEVTAHLSPAARPALPVSIVAVLLAVSFGRALHEDSDEMNWPTMEKIASKVNDVTPPNGTLWAGEQIFFLTGRPVPDGMEFQASQKLDMPAEEARPLHILPLHELERRVKASVYDTIEICDDDRTKELDLPGLYSKSEEIKACTIFWDKKE